MKFSQEAHLSEGPSEAVSIKHFDIHCYCIHGTGLFWLVFGLWLKSFQLEVCGAFRFDHF